MANSRSSTDFHEYATVDIAPSGVDLGYWTNAVCLRDKIKDGLAKDKMWFSIREQDTDSSQASETSSVTVTLQFKCKSDEGWQDYISPDGTTIDVGNRLCIEDSGAEVQWRAGVKDGAFMSGKVVFGFDW